MDARYLEAIVNEDEQHVVLGRTLHPFCFYDLLILEIDENPLWTGQRDIRWGDLVTAALICSSEPKWFLNPWRMRSWWSRVWQTVWVLWCRRRYDLPKEVGKFEAYVKDYWNRPRVWSSEDGKAVKSPWLLSIVAYIEAHSNASEHEIMSAPAGKMMWKYTAIAEVLHGADVMSEDEEAGIKALGLTLR